MENNLSLEKITQALLVIERIKGLLNGDAREYEKLTASADKVAMVHDTMTTLVDFFPAARDGSVGGALKVCNDCSSTYRELKRHLRGMRGQRVDIDKILKVFKAVKPLMGSSNRVYFDKVIGILDIING